MNILKTQAEILNEIEAKLVALNSPLTDWNIGSIMRVLSEVFADVGSELYTDLYLYLLQNYIKTAVGDWLDLNGADWSQARKAGAKATCADVAITINPQEATFILPIGTIVTTSDPTPRQYETLSEVEITPGNTTGHTSVRAVEVGALYNAPVHYIADVLEVSGIVKVDNLEAITGGEDEETDDAYRTRLLLYIREALARATQGALEYGALSVAGVSSVKVDKNMPNHWELYPYLKLKYSGVWEEIDNAVCYYGKRKSGTGHTWLYAIGSKMRVTLWKDSTYGECSYRFDSEAPITIDLNATTPTKIVIEKEFASEGWHKFELDTGVNIGSIESIEVYANYLGSNFIYIDDGTGEPSWLLIRNVYAEMEHWVSSGEQFFVKRCEKKYVDLTIYIQVASGVTSSSILTAVQSAVIAYMNSLKMGQTLYISQLNRVILGVANVENCIVQSANIIPLDYEIIRPRNIEVSLV